MVAVSNASPAADRDKASPAIKRNNNYRLDYDGIVSQVPYTVDKNNNLFAEEVRLGPLVSRWKVKGKGGVMGNDTGQGATPNRSCDKGNGNDRGWRQNSWYGSTTSGFSSGGSGSDGCVNSGWASGAWGWNSYWCTNDKWNHDASN